MNDGGSVFPKDDYTYLASGGGHPGRYEKSGQQGGMSLRDWFAGMALQGVCANPDVTDTLSKALSLEAGGGISLARTLSEMAYETADAMIKQREKPNDL